MLRRGQEATTFAPKNAPTTAAVIIEKRVVTSTVTAPIKINAWVTVGRVWPTLRVPGIHSSFTIFQALKIAVVGA